MFSCQHPKSDARGKVLEMAKIVTDHLLLESLKSIRKTSLDYVEINPDATKPRYIAACSDPFARYRLSALRKTYESSPGRVNVTRRVEASDEKSRRCLHVVRIDSERSRFPPLRLL